MDKTWPVQDVKARLSEVLREAEKEPQIITYRGEPKFEVRLISTKRAKADKGPKTLADWIFAAPKVPDFKLPPRKREKPRKVF
ncbi:MAG TPA: type II toxin-antitoxin system Phd/YefM family antitoxin [Rhizomicrobium sp.]|jgi:prevent-host-death family protein|nr:type II toxin-antitoxin system Phd/YefM family antitoxin [Rhizomicrobium sp.]